ncbi:MAG: hypothetical protein ACP5NV_00565 [Candidatus Woesearchaeota archaeon]
MKDIESEILNRFRKEPKEYDTSQLAKTIFPEYTQVEELLASPDKTQRNEGKDLKFKLHRKLLYYLNKLVQERILKVSRIAEKGEKVFSLTIDDGNITVEYGLKKITITKQISLSNNIEAYEKRGLMKKFEENNWVNHINAVMLESSLIKTDKLYSIIREVFNSVNDVIALNDFQKHINEDGLIIIKKLSQETVDTDKNISLIICFENLDKEKFKEFIKEYASLNPKKINMIFHINSRELLRNSELLKVVIQEFSKEKIKINIQNKDLRSAPMFKGRAGIYGFDEEEYQTYLKLVKGKTIGIASSQLSIAVNINKILETNNTAEFRQAILNAAKVLLSANAVQRRKNNEYFKGINNLNSSNPADFYRFGTNYIRLWNYDWYKDLKENKELLELLTSTKETINTFCLSEETIFKSCGIPMRFRISFSSAFRNFDTKFMGEREYKKANVKGIDDYGLGEIKNFMIARERLFEIFDGCDRLRIFRAQEFKEEDILKEFLFILNNYKIPFFAYDFSQLRGMIKLTNFM